MAHGYPKGEKRRGGSDEKVQRRSAPKPSKHQKGSDRKNHGTPHKRK